MISDNWILFTLGIIASTFSGYVSFCSSPHQGSLCEMWRVIGLLPWSCCHYFSNRKMVLSCACCMPCLCFPFSFCLFFVLPGMTVLSAWGERNLVMPLEIKSLELEHTFLVYLIFHWELLRTHSNWFSADFCESQSLVTKQEVLLRKCRLPNMTARSEVETGLR